MVIDKTFPKFRQKYQREINQSEVIRFVFVDAGRWPNDCPGCRFGVPKKKGHISLPGKKRECLLKLSKPKPKEARECPGFIEWNPIRVVRESKGMSRRELADKINRNKSTVQTYELNSRMPNMITLEWFARGLSVSPTILFELYQLGPLSARR